MVTLFTTPTPGYFLTAFKNSLFLCFLLCITLVNAQERQYLKGKLLYKNTNVVAANVVNNTAQINTITDAEGEFEIAVAEGDEIIFSSLQYRIRAVTITPEILRKNRLIVSVNENITALDEVVITPENTEKFLDLKEEEFKGYDYIADKSTQVVNKVADDRQLANGLNLVNIAKLIGQAIAGKNGDSKSQLKPSEILPQVFEPEFFENTLQLKPDQVIDFLAHVDKQLPTRQLLQKSKEFQLIDFLIKESEAYQDQLRKAENN